MKILIDSTEYKQDRGLNKEDISLIKDLGKKNLIELHIPWFVYKECISSCVNEIAIALNQVESTLKSFNRKGLDDVEYQNSKRIAREVEKLKKEVGTSVENLWNEFIKVSNGILYEFDERESIEVFNNYFDGGKPFKSLKNRKDIPDAFIYITIQKISITSVLHLVSNDKNLTDKCVDDKNIIVHTSLKELFEHSDYSTIETKYQKLKEIEKTENAKTIILDNLLNFEDAVYEYTRKIDYLVFEDDSLRSDNGEATIYAIDNPIVKIIEDEIKFIGDEVFVPIEVEGEASIDYAIFKSDYWMYDDLPSVSEDLNKHYFLLEDVVTLKMIKTLTFNINEINEDEDLDIEINEFDDIKIKDE